MTFRNYMKLPMQGPQGSFNPLGAFVILANYHCCCFCFHFGILYSRLVNLILGTSFTTHVAPASVRRCL